MSVSEDYEIKFQLYDGNEDDLDIILPNFELLRDNKKNESGVMAKVISHFLNGIIELINGDIAFWNEDYRGAFLHYQDASRLFNNFKISRSVKVKLDQFVNRIDHRTNGLKLIVEGLLTSNLELKDNLFVKALEEFNNEVAIANQMGDQMSSYAAFSRASFAQSQMLLYRAEGISNSNSGLAKKYILESREAIRQAAFIDKRFLFHLDKINDELDIITRKRILTKAELFADDATNNMENSLYSDAVSGFNKASLLYKRASVIASDTSSRRMLLAFSTLYEASIKEALATEYLKNIDLEDATDNFKAAISMVDKSIALLGHFGTEELINSFKCQRDYYKGMYTQSKATLEFDIEKYSDAKELFVESKLVFKNAIDLAKTVGNQTIINLSNDAISEIAGYITMCENLE